MHKRLTAGILWLLAGWTVGSFLSFALGIGPLLGPILGAAAAAVFAGDPRRIVRSPKTPSSATPGSPDPA